MKIRQYLKKMRKRMERFTFERFYRGRLVQIARVVSLLGEDSETGEGPTHMKLQVKEEDTGEKYVDIASLTEVSYAHVENTGYRFYDPPGTPPPIRR